MKQALLSLCILTGLSQTAISSEADRLFDHEGRVPLIHIDVDKDAVESLKRETRKNVPCKVTMGDRTWSNVAIHIKGGRGSMQPWDWTPGLTLSFNEFEPGQLFLGELEKIHLNNEVQDPRYMTEILASELFRSAGVPCARATHVIVELNERKMGVYVMVEAFDRQFLKRSFGSSKGNLYDSEFCREIDEPLKRSHGSADVDDHSDLKALVAACRQTEPDQKFAKVGQLCDLDRFFTMMAIEAVLWHWDGYCMNKNNYRVYHDPKSAKFVFMPHGMDQMWQHSGGTIYPEWKGLVARRLMQTNEGKEAYRKKLQEVMDKYYQTAEFECKIDTMVARLKPAMEPVNKDAMRRIVIQNERLKSIIEKREENIRTQLKP
ncbi:MAG: CotH kinase family protein [Gemmataceae bacterium]